MSFCNSNLKQGYYLVGTLGSLCSGEYPTPFTYKFKGDNKIDINLT